MKQRTLPELRKEIDAIDAQLVSLLSKRATLAISVGHAKQSALKYNPEREAAVIRNAIENNDGPLPDKVVVQVFRAVINGCLELESPLKVSCLGPRGTYSEDAVRAHFGDGCDLQLHQSLDQAVRAVETGRADMALLPVENSIEGSVNRTLDLLQRTSLEICSELTLGIHHQLLSHAQDLSSITEVLGHPQALAQCRNWLERNLPQATQTTVSSNGEAARLASKQTHIAALASQNAAAIYELPILEKNIEDEPSNQTRFIMVGRHTTKSSGQDKTSLICSSANQAGGLHKILSVFAAGGVNITKLESRPQPGASWEYVFYIDIDGHQEDPAVAKCLNDLKRVNALVKVVGSYPKAEVVYE